MPTDEVAAIARRLDTVERNASDLANSFGQQVKVLSGMENRIIVLEEIHRDRRVDDARREEREKAMQKDISEVRDDISEIKGSFVKLLWIVATAVIGAFVAFILAGGLNLA